MKSDSSSPDRGLDDEETLGLLRISDGAATIPPLPGTHVEIFQISKLQQQDMDHHHRCLWRRPGVASAIFNLATSVIGAGIMALPAAMRVLGLPLGAAAIAAMGLVSEASIEMVIHWSSRLGASTYGTMVASALGDRKSWPKLASELAIVVNNGGILIVYLIIVGDVVCGGGQHKGLFQLWTGRDIDRRLVLFVTLVTVLAPLSSLRRIDSLRFSSAASVALAVLFVVLCCGLATVRAFQGKLQPPRLLPPLTTGTAVLELLTIVPVMTNAFICHFNVPPIFDELRLAEKELVANDATAAAAASVDTVAAADADADMVAASRASTLLCTCVYLATAAAGYLLFGDATAADVLANFDGSTAIDAAVRVGYVLHLLLVFPVVHFSLRQTVDELLFPQAVSPLATAAASVRYWSLTASLLLLIWLGSALIPNIWIAFQFTGATAGLLLGFIFPALVALMAAEDDDEGKREMKKRRRRVVAWSMLVMAAISSLLGLATNIFNVLSNHVD